MAATAALAAIVAEYQLASTNASQVVAAFFPPLSANAPGTNDAAWSSVLHAHRHAIASTANNQAVLLTAVTANLGAILPNLNATAADLAAITANAATFDGTNDGDATTPRPTGANLPTSTTHNIQQAVGLTLATHAAAYRDHMFQALVITALPPAAAPPAQGQPQQVNVIPTFVGKMPKLDGTDVKAFRPWMLCVHNLVTAQFAALPSDLLVAQKIHEGLTSCAIKAAKTSMPQPPAAMPNDDGSKMAHFNQVMQWLQDAFGNPNEVLNTARDFQAL